MDLVCLGKIVKSHGVRGDLKIDSFTEDPASLVNYTPLFFQENDNAITISLKSVKNNSLICRIENIDDRDKADSLRGKKIYTYRDSLKIIEDEDNFYINDLIGLDVKTNDKVIAVIQDVRDFGAGNIIELKFTASGKTEMFSFTKEIFPVIDTNNKLVIFNPPSIFESD